MNCEHGVSLRKPCHQCAPRQVLNPSAKAVEALLGAGVPPAQPTLPEFMALLVRTLTEVTERLEYVVQQEDTFPHLKMNGGALREDTAKRARALLDSIAKM